MDLTMCALILLHGGQNGAGKDFTFAGVTDKEDAVSLLERVEREVRSGVRLRDK